MIGLRRLAVLTLVVAVAACSKDGDPPAGYSRVNAVTTREEPKVSLDAFCDARTPADGARRFGLPQLAGAAPSSSPGSGAWRWVNVWATWCKPCVEEIPRLRRWRAELARAGTPFDLVFLSVDESDEVVAAWRRTHPEAPDGARIRSAELLAPWLESLGLAAAEAQAAAIPVHVFVDPAGVPRCVRSGGVSDTDLAAVKRIFAGG